MKLVLMKRSKEDRNHLIKETNEEYPWELKICLHGPELKKLGVDLKKLKAGQTVKIIAEASIVNINLRPQIADQTLGLQIEKMGIDWSDAEYDKAWEEANAEQKKG